jgi:hypothetical protein
VADETLLNKKHRKNKERKKGSDARKAGLACFEKHLK